MNVRILYIWDLFKKNFLCFRIWAGITIEDMQWGILICAEALWLVWSSESWLLDVSASHCFCFLDQMAACQAFSIATWTPPCLRRDKKMWFCWPVSHHSYSRGWSYVLYTVRHTFFGWAGSLISSYGNVYAFSTLGKGVQPLQDVVLNYHCLSLRCML